MSCDSRAWIEATCCSLRRKIQAAKCRGTRAGTAMGNRVVCATIQHGIGAGLVVKVEMIGEREIDVLVLPEMSRAERAGRAKKNEQFPLSCPQAARQRHWAKQRCGYIGRKSLCITPFGLYPASSVSGRGPAGLGKPKLLMYISGICQVYTVMMKSLCVALQENDAF